MNNTFVIDLASRYAKAFGMKAVNQLNTAVIDVYNGNYDFEVYPSVDLEVDRMVLSHQTTELQFGGMLTDVDGIFAPPLMIDFCREKDLIETQVSGSNNVVVERWGTKPWQMDIRGILVDVENRIYPKRKIDDLCLFFEINDIIDVEGVQFEDKRIESVYFKSIRITPVEGFQDTVQFSLIASQIKPVEFSILK